MNAPAPTVDTLKGTQLLIVDDVPANLAVLGDLLHGAGYQVRAATSGRGALRLAGQDPQPTLILLDVMMPEMDGYAVLDQLRAERLTEEIPVIFLTALDNPEDEERGFRHGAVDYIVKPFNPEVVLARVRTQLLAKLGRDFLRDRNDALEAEIGRRMRENELIQSVAIRAMAHLAETRDPETGNHILRTQGYVHLLGTLLRPHERFAEVLDDRYIAMLARSAPLHDIGKVGIPDHILLKPGKLTPDEWEIMKTHAALGSEAIHQAERDIAEPVEFLTLAKEIARWHHERWDGNGYPDRLAGEAIPISARLMALADVFDALISSRAYKPAMPVEKARDIISGERGHQFDPDVVDAFLGALDAFVAIAEQHREQE